MANRGKFSFNVPIKAANSVVGDIDMTVRIDQINMDGRLGDESCWTECAYEAIWRSPIPSMGINVGVAVI